MSENVASYYWRGHGPLWKAYWLYGVLGSNVLALILLLLMQRSALGSGWFQLVLLLGAYTVWIVVAVWRCAFNVENPLYGHMARALTVAWAINAFLVLGFLELQFLQAVTNFVAAEAAAWCCGPVGGGEVDAHHDVGVAALLEVRIKSRFAGRAPARLLVQMATDRTVPENPGVAQRPAKKSVWCE